MAIQYVKFKTKVAINGVSEEKYVARLKQETEIGFDKIADIIEKKSTISKGDILGVLSELETSVLWMLESGHKVTLGILGSFHPTIQAMAVDTPQEVNSDTIRRFRCVFKPSKFLKKKFKNISFILADNIIRVAKYKADK